MATSLIKVINHNLVVAMKAGNKEVVLTLRNLISEAKNAAIETKEDVNDSHYLIALKRMAKKLKCSIELFNKGGRNDLVEKESSQLKIVEEYLPVSLSEEETKRIVENAINSTSAKTIKDMGTTMKWIRENTNESLDFSIVNRLLKEKLSV